MADRRNPFDSVEVKEATERGDIAKSLQQLIYSQFISKRFKDIFSSTRFTKREIYLLSQMEIRRAIDKILSLSELDTRAEGLSQEEQKEIQELYELKKRFIRNPTALSYAIYEAFMYMFGLGLQSLDGMSRMEGVEISSGATRRIMEPEQVGTLDKIRRRLTGKVLYYE